MKKVDYAYLAGFLDGEGYIGIDSNPSRYTYRVHVEVTNTERWILEWYKLAFGGFIVCQKDSDSKHKDCYRWHGYGRNAKEILETLLPYLKLKKWQSELALQYLKNTTSCRGYVGIPEAERILRKSYRERMLALNKRGK